MQLGPSPLLKTGGLHFGPRGSRALAALRGEKGRALNYLDNSYADRDMTLALGKATDLLTFSRGYSGPYLDLSRIWRTADSNVLRLTHEPLTGEPLGALLEGARAELVRQSANMSPSALWSSSTSFASINPRASVFAGATAWEHVADGVASRGRFVGVGVDVAPNTNYRASIIVEDTDNPADKVTFGLYKKGDSSPWRGFGEYDWASNAITQRGGSIAGAKVYDWDVGPNGGRLRKLSFSVNSMESADRYFVYPNSVGTPLPGQSTIIHHASLSPLPYDASPIITGDAAGFQAADNLSFARAGTPEGTVVIRGRTAPGIGTSQYAWQWDGGSGANRMTLIRLVNRTMAFIVAVGGAQAVRLEGPIVADNTDFAAAVTFKKGQYALSLNGAPALVNTAYTGDLPVVNTYRIGSSNVGEQWGGTVASLRLTPRATDPADLPGMLS